MTAIVVTIVGRLRVLPPEVLALWVGFVFLLTLIGTDAFRQRKRGQLPPIKAQGVLPQTAPTVTFDPDQFFHQAYNSVLAGEAQANFRVVAARYDAGNAREEFLTRMLAVGMITAIYELAWASIYKSQLDLLNALNANALNNEQVRRFYDTAVANYPEVYENYSYEQWLSWLMVEQQFVLQLNLMFGITERGRDFLKFLIHSGKPVQLKKG